MNLAHTNGCTRIKTKTYGSKYVAYGCICISYSTTMSAYGKYIAQGKIMNHMAYLSAEFVLNMQGNKPGKAKE